MIYETGAEGGWGAYAPDLPGLGVTGGLLAEVKTLIREGIEFHIKRLREDDLPLPERSALSGELVEVSSVDPTASAAVVPRGVQPTRSSARRPTACAAAMLAP